jgi:hypothetical protein
MAIGACIERPGANAFRFLLPAAERPALAVAAVFTFVTPAAKRSWERALNWLRATMGNSLTETLEKVS